MHLVPFDEKWAGSETKLDLKGIYARVGDPTTLTTPLPLRRHLDWARKGLVFVCLSELDELGVVAPSLREKGLDPLQMRDCFGPKGAFNVQAYLAEVRADRSEQVAQLREKVQRFGVEAVVEMMRLSDPTFELPAELLQASSAPAASEDAGGGAAHLPAAPSPAPSVAPAAREDRPAAQGAKTAKGKAAAKHQPDADVVGAFEG